MAKSDISSVHEYVRLLTEHQEDICAYILSLIPGDSESDDVLQQTNIALWRKRSNFTLGTNFRAWAFSMARFEVLNHRKKKARDHIRLLDDDLLGTMAVEHEQYIEGHELHLDALRHCVGSLSERHQELLNCRYSRRGALTEYSNKTGRSIASLSVTLGRLRITLANCVEQYLVKKGELI